MSASAFAHGLVQVIVEPAARSLAVGLLAALAMAVFRLTRPTARLGIWTTVLYVALAMPLLGIVAPHTTVTVPVATMASQAAASPVVRASSDAPSASTIDPAEAGRLDVARLAWGDEPAAVGLASLVARISWLAIGLALYFLMAFVLLARLAIGLRVSRTLARTAQPVEDASTLQRLAVRASAAGLRRPPALRECASLSVPATLGVLHPVILLPADWRAWEAADLEAILAHELSHVARRDALTQRLADLHRAVFWFSPLAWWLDRQLTDLAEQASDEAALASGADSTRYAETLVGFLARISGAGSRIRWHGVSMATGGGVERRVDRILSWRGSARTRGVRVAVLACVAIPVAAAIATVRPVLAAAPPAPAPPPVAAPPAPPPPAVSSAPALPPPPPAKPAPPAIARTVDEDGPRYVVVDADGGAIIVRANREDMRHALALRDRFAVPFIWFERDEQPFIITDAATIDEVRALFAPVHELGREQAALGRQQGELGRQQGDLGRKQARALREAHEKLRALLDEAITNGTAKPESRR
jgi:beta-lactamase regulating signal transducer with metallopeptidase domain